MNVRLWWLAALVVTAVGVGTAAFAWHSWQSVLRQVNAPLVDAPDRVEIRPGETARGLGQWLIDAGHLDVPDWGWRLYLYQRASNDIRRGEYALGADTSAADLLDAAVRGQVISYRLTLVEGTTFKDLRALLAGAPRLRQPGAQLSDDVLMAQLGRPGVHPEGRFFPDTYSYTASDSDLDVLRRAANRLDTVLADAWAQRAPELPLADPDEALVLASIVEKETGRAADRTRVAGVFVRRLRRGMRLQTDPTIIYGLGDGFDGNLTRTHLRTDAPYNTYTRHGLPPTPICMPSRAAIEAAVHPADGTALYFVARGDGTSEFSDTLADHQRAVRRYQLARQ